MSFLALISHHTVILSPLFFLKHVTARSRIVVNHSNQSSLCSPQSDSYPIVLYLTALFVLQKIKLLKDMTFYCFDKSIFFLRGSCLFACIFINCHFRREQVHSFLQGNRKFKRDGRKQIFIRISIFPENLGAFF